MICKQVQAEIRPRARFYRVFSLCHRINYSRATIRAQLISPHHQSALRLHGADTRCQRKTAVSLGCYDAAMRSQNVLPKCWLARAMQALSAVAVTTVGLLAFSVSPDIHAADSADHPLIGTIWDVAAERAVSSTELIEQLADTRFVLLGEIHDHPEHHRIQAELLEGLLERGRRPALVMEQYDRDQQAAIDAIRSSEDDMSTKLSALGAALPASWDWSAYAPLAALALKHELPLVAANLPRRSLRERARAGESPPAVAAWTEQHQAELAQIIDASHCGKLPPKAIGAIVGAQRLRDAALAEALQAYAASGAVAILGNGHARRDLGVPLYLAARRSLSIGMIEVGGSDNSDPRNHAYGTLGPRYDYIWFTTPVVRTTDPCDSIPSLPKPGTAANPETKNTPR